MNCIEIEAKSLLRRMRRIDSWFVASRGMNLYRGCAHDCAYCDGRAEKYTVAGRFGKDVQVKVNAVELLKKELGHERIGQGELWPERAAGTGGFLLLGGGVGDCYQPAEERYGIAGKALRLLAERGFPVHVLTKSTLVLRDADILERIARSAGALVSFSLCTADDSIAAQFEPGASPPSERLRALSILTRRGIPCGVFLMPVIPFLTDSPRAIGQSVSAAASAGAEYTLFGSMTLKWGRQRDHFLSVLGGVQPDLLSAYAALYPGPQGERPDWGNATGDYVRRVTRIFASAARRYALPPRIPRRLFPRGLNRTDLGIVLRDQIRALRDMAAQPPRGPSEAALNKEIQDTGTCALYDQLMSEYLPVT